jgi:hypothetical protein
VHAQVSWPELGDDLTGEPHLSVLGEREAGTLSGKAEMGRGPFRCLGRFVPLWPFSLF